MSVSLKNTLKPLKRAAMYVGVAAVSFSQMGCGGDDPVNPKEPGGTTPPVVQKGSFKVVGDLARLDMNGTDRIPGSVTRPDTPPTMTRLFAYYYVNGKEQYLGGNVSQSGSEKFGFKRIDPNQAVTFSKIEGSPENRRYKINNASHVYFVNKSDTTALEVGANSQLIAFPNPESTAYIYKAATEVNGSGITLQRQEPQ